VNQEIVVVKTAEAVVDSEEAAADAGDVEGGGAEAGEAGAEGFADGGNREIGGGAGEGGDATTTGGCADDAFIEAAEVNAVGGLMFSTLTVIALVNERDGLPLSVTWILKLSKGLVS
jgi:hypothetical protein